MNYFSFLLDLYLSDLSENAINKLRKIVTERNFRKGDIIIKENQKVRDFYIIGSGVIRGYIIDEKGKEHIQQLSVTSQVCGPLSYILKNQPSKITYDCLTNCKVLICDFDSFSKLTNESHEISLLYNKILQLIFLAREHRLRSLTMYNATDRYRMLLEEIPEIESLIPLYHIAAYLNITNVQLSRIRSKLHKK